MPILFGRPAPDAGEAARDRQLILAGCLTRGDGSDPQWQCQEDASRRYLDELALQSLTSQIDEALQASDNDFNAAAAAAGRGFLAAQDDW